MKRFTALIALMLCVTIGGVYATWSYAGSDDIADAFAEAKVTISDVELVGANGTYKIESNLVLTVEPESFVNPESENIHNAVLVFSSNDDQPVYLKVTFTPAEHASEDIKKDGIPSELYFTTTTEMKYDGDDIFEFTNVPDGVFSPNFEWTKEGNIFTYTLNQAQLETMIGLTKPFLLDTKSDHDAFRAALTGNIVVRVTDGIIDGNKLPTE